MASQCFCDCFYIWSLCDGDVSLFDPFALSNMMHMRLTGLKKRRPIHSQNLFPPPAICTYPTITALFSRKDRSKLLPRASACRNVPFSTGGVFRLKKRPKFLLLYGGKPATERRNRYTPLLIATPRRLSRNCQVASVHSFLSPSSKATTNAPFRVRTGGSAAAAPQVREGEAGFPARCGELPTQCTVSA